MSEQDAAKAWFLTGSAAPVIRCRKSTVEELSVFLPKEKTRVVLAVMGMELSFDANDARNLAAAFASAADIIDGGG